MRLNPHWPSGLTLTTNLPQANLQIATRSTLLIAGIGAAAFFLVLILLIILRRRRRSSPGAAGLVEPVSEESFLQAVKLDDLIAMGTDLYQNLGHSVRDVTHPSKDVADLIIDAENGERWIARCLAKPTINSQEVASFRKAIRKARIPQAALITNGSFTSQALDEAERGDIHTLDITQLTEYMSKARQAEA